jgi:hypothetical protein
MRLLWDDFLFFLVPFLAFAGFLLLAKRRVFEAQSWKRPLPWLIAIGLLFSIASLVITYMFTERSMLGYVPPHMENGKLIKGEFK